jgi:DNA segregation ATPase FtsK/SpoIIIE-like protein
LQRRLRTILAKRPNTSPAARPGSAAAEPAQAGPRDSLNPEDARRKSRIIEETLAQFGVPARVTEVRPGPTVTQFGVSPGYMNRGAEGDDQRKVRVSQIASLADDLALALAAKSLRVEAPVPGRAVVGIEVPNEKISPVSLRAVLDSAEFHKCGKPLCFAVGMDVAGTPVVADLSVMPRPVGGRHDRQRQVGVRQGAGGQSGDAQHAGGTALAGD